MLDVLQCEGCADDGHVLHSAARICLAYPWIADEGDDKFKELRGIGLRVGLITAAYVLPVATWGILPAFIKVGAVPTEVVV
jgi:hypothetical protein